jgi:hypothetical protein
MRRLHGAGLEYLGKTLILGPSSLFTTWRGDADMFSLFVQYVLFRKSAAAIASVQPVVSVAHGLMESADASAGRDPRHSAELRAAALASLSVL